MIVEGVIREAHHLVDKDRGPRCRFAEHHVARLEPGEIGLESIGLWAPFGANLKNTITFACEMLGKGRAQGGILGENMRRLPHVGEAIANPAQSLKVLSAPPHVDNKKAGQHFAGDHASGIIRSAPRLERRIPTHDAARIVWGPAGGSGEVALADPMRGRGRWLLLPLGGEDVRRHVFARGSDLVAAEARGRQDRQAGRMIYSGAPRTWKISASCGLIGRLSVSPVGSRRKNHLL